MPHTQAHQSDHTRTPTADFRLAYHGTITTITPLTDRCREWVEKNVEIEPWQHFGIAIAVERRYVEQLADAMIDEGLVMEGKEKTRSRMEMMFALLSTAVLLAACAAKPQYTQPSAAELAEAERQAFVASYRKTPEGQEALRRSIQMCQDGDNDGCIATFIMLGQSPEVVYDAFHGSEAHGTVAGPTLCFSTSVGHGDVATRCD